MARFSSHFLVVMCKKFIFHNQVEMQTLKSV